MKKLFWLLACSSLALAAGRYSQKFHYDLTGDGRPEMVRLQTFDSHGATYAQLVVQGPAGKNLWVGPRKRDSPLVFGGDFDLGEICAVGDLFGDGKAELLGTYQKSDVSPTRYRVLRWEGNQFVHLRSGSLIPAPQKPATFVWGKDPGASCWIDSVDKALPAGRFEVQIMDMSQLPNPTSRATGHFEATGFVRE